MGFALSLLYIALVILSPAEALPALAPYRILVWIGLLALGFSIPAITNREVLSAPQAKLLIIVTLGIIPAFVLTTWFGGLLEAMQAFIPSSVVFYLVLLNFRSISRLRILALVVLGITLYLVVTGAIAYRRGDPDHPMIFQQKTDGDTWFPRMRAFGYLNDPNDLAQFVITVGPLLWLGWRKNRTGRNLLMTLVPGGIFLLGVYLTHSRGGMIALAAVLLFAFKDKIGKTASAILAGLGFVGASIANFAGGRSFSMGAGLDRIDAWSEGLQMVRSSPIFGVGLNQFAENYMIPAHNSFVHCAAELGLFGFYFWMALLVFSMVELGSIARWQPAAAGVAGNPKAVAAAATAEAVEWVPWSPLPKSNGGASDPELQLQLKRWATVLRLGFVGYLTAAFFLSRSYAPALFLLLGMAAAVRSIAVFRAGMGPVSSARRALRTTGIISVGVMTALYILVRIRWAS